MRKVLVTLLIALTLGLGNVACANQTIISVPSSDVLPSGEIILKQSNKFTPWHESFVSLTPSVIMGTGKGTEASFAVGTTLDDGASVKLDLGVKKVFRIGKSTRFTVGGRLSPNLTDGKNPNSFLYAHGSYLIKKTRTTLTSGVYVMGKEQAPNMTGAIVGIDQTIIPNRLRVVADWMSRGDAGNSLSAGLKIRPHAQTSITTAVLIPNCNDDRLAFSVSVSQYVGNIFELIKKDKENL
ncbi:hypothetical protein IJE86_05395 [bacterium]|nr:hypothetical protein [bacterium]